MNNQRKTTQKTEKHQKASLEKSLRTNGYVFPKTEDEMNLLDKVIGSTDLPLPVSLQDTSFLFKRQKDSSSGAAKVIPMFFETENILQQLRATNALGNQYLLYPFRQGYSIYEYVDPWGTPFRIEIGQGSTFIIRSAGKNGKFGDRNDLVIHSSSNNLVNP